MSNLENTPCEIIAPLDAKTEKALARNADKIRALGKQTVETIVKMGGLLAESKKTAGHGNWLPWLDREFGWKEQTARNFIQIYELAGKVPNIGDFKLPVSGLYLLAAPSTPFEALDAVIGKAAAGEAVSVAEIRERISEAKAGPVPKIAECEVPPALVAVASEPTASQIVECPSELEKCWRNLWEAGLRATREEMEAFYTATYDEETDERADQIKRFAMPVRIGIDKPRAGYVCDKYAPLDQPVNKCVPRSRARQVRREEAAVMAAA